MNTEELSRQVTGSIPTLFACSVMSPDRVRVETPFLYPDGDLIDVFVFERAPGVFCATDFGEAFSWLELRSGRSSPTRRQEQTIKAICQTLRISEDRGQLESVVENAGEIGDAVVRIAQAVVQVADLCRTFEPRLPKIVGTEVEQWLTVKNVSFERNILLDGSSGERWTVDYRTSVANSTSLVFLMSTDSKRVARRRVEHVVAGCFDLNHRKPARDRLPVVSLFDDRGDVWGEEHFRLVEPLSRVARWSQRDRFGELLGLR